MIKLIASLSSHVSWFEPPIVCRFETEEEFFLMKQLDEEETKKKRRDDDDLDEVEEDEDVKKKPVQKETIVSKPIKAREIKVVEDFNLLDMPKKVNLKPLFEEFIIPMMPDGYEIKYEPKKSTTSFVGGTARRRSCYTDRIYSIDDIVYQTRQPRSLFPNCKTKKILKIVKRRTRYELSTEQEPSSDEENDESMYSNSVDSDQFESMRKISIYMFSKFMRDLEDLVDVAMPILERKIAEMSSNLTMSGAEINEKSSTAAADRKDSGISLTKANSKSLLEISFEDSDQDSTEDDEEENQEIAKFSLIDTIVKEANLKRCD